jgi:glycosyltransferase involved in cell wall biosynthesis
MTDYPLFSVLIPTFNRCQFLKKALDSVLAQTYPNIEIVVLDNASTDATQVYLEQMARQYHSIRYIRNTTNIGGIANWKKIETYAKGEYFVLLPDDDYLLPLFCETAVSDLLAYPAVSIWYSRTLALKNDKEFTLSLLGKRCESALSFAENVIRGRRHIFIMSMVFKRSKSPIFNNNSEIIDQLAFLNALDSNGIIYSSKVLSVWLVHMESWWHKLSPKKRFKALSERNDIIASILKSETSWHKKIANKLYLNYFLAYIFLDSYLYQAEKIRALKIKLNVLLVLLKPKMVLSLPFIAFRNARRYITAKWYARLFKKQETLIAEELNTLFDISLSGEEENLNLVMKSITDVMAISSLIRVSGSPIQHAVAEYYFNILKKMFFSYGVPPGVLIAEKAMIASEEEKGIAKKFVDKMIDSVFLRDLESTTLFKQALTVRTRHVKELSYLAPEEWKKAF